MTIQLADKKLKARVTPFGFGMSRLVIEYPTEPEYARIVKEAFIHLLKTGCDTTSGEQNGDERR